MKKKWLVILFTVLFGLTAIGLVGGYFLLNYHELTTTRYTGGDGQLYSFKYYFGSRHLKGNELNDAGGQSLGLAAENVLLMSDDVHKDGTALGMIIQAEHPGITPAQSQKLRRQQCAADLYEVEMTEVDATAEVCDMTGKGRKVSYAVAFEDRGRKYIAVFILLNATGKTLSEEELAELPDLQSYDEDIKTIIKSIKIES